MDLAHFESIEIRQPMSETLCSKYSAHTHTHKGPRGHRTSLSSMSTKRCGKHFVRAQVIKGPTIEINDIVIAGKNFDYRNNGRIGLM